MFLLHHSSFFKWLISYTFLTLYFFSLLLSHHMLSFIHMTHTLSSSDSYLVFFWLIQCSSSGHNNLFWCKQTKISQVKLQFQRIDMYHTKISCIMYSTLACYMYVPPMSTISGQLFFWLMKKWNIIPERKLWVLCFRHSLLLYLVLFPLCIALHCLISNMTHACSILAILFIMLCSKAVLY